MVAIGLMKIDLIKGSLVLMSLVPRLQPSFHHLQYRKGLQPHSQATARLSSLILRTLPEAMMHESRNFMPEINTTCKQGRREDWEGPGQNTNSGAPQNGLCEGGQGTPPRKF